MAACLPGYKPVLSGDGATVCVERRNLSGPDGELVAPDRVPWFMWLVAGFGLGLLSGMLWKGRNV